MDDSRPRGGTTRGGLGRRREEHGGRREQAGVRRRVRPWGPTDRRLVDVDDLVDVLHPLDAVVRARPLLRARKRLREAPVEDLVHERALPRSRHAGDRDEEPERDPDVDVLEVVLARAAHDEGLRSRLATPGRLWGWTAYGKGCARV